MQNLPGVLILAGAAVIAISLIVIVITMARMSGAASRQLQDASRQHTAAANAYDDGAAVGKKMWATAIERRNAGRPVVLSPIEQRTHATYVAQLEANILATGQTLPDHYRELLPYLQPAELSIMVNVP